MNEGAPGAVKAKRRGERAGGPRSEPPGTGEVADVLDLMPASPPTGVPSAWVLEVDWRGEEEARLYESLLSVADGVVGTRGSLEEDGPSAAPAVFAAGVYEPAQGTGQALVTLPSWAMLSLPASLGAGRRLLDLRSGVLWRIVQSGGTTVFRSARWASLARPGTEVLVAEAPSWVLAAEQGKPAADRFERRSALGGWVTVRTDNHCRETDGRSKGKAGARSLSLARVVSIETGSAGAPPSDPLPTARHTAGRPGIEGLLAEQRRAWARRWRAGDVEVVGDPELTLAVRFAVFQLSAAAADAGEAAVGARGLSGPAYAGHVFWDADVFVLPVLAATHPQAARAMLEYRIRRLDAARRSAHELGRRGARFPWESAADGTDVTPRRGIDELGRSVPISTGELEEHITADVAWAAWHYASMAGDWGFLEGEGGALVTETARYWASRLSLDGNGKAHIDGVTGPDEYHEGVDDNAFTNLMAAWNLRRGAELIERHVDRGGVTGTSDAELAEARCWRSLAQALVTGYHPEQARHEQFTGYDALEPLLAADIGRAPLPADLVLGRERLVGSQIVKQADVVMAHHMIPEAMPTGSLRGDFDHYLARTTHGSSLSPGVHAAVAARAGYRAEAVNLLDLARRVDMDDLTGTTAAGLHMAALGGLWQAIVFGFAGLRVTSPDDEALVVDPRLPEAWRELRVRLSWHGRTLALRLRNDAVHVRCPAPLRVVVSGGAPFTVSAPGAWIAVERREGWSS